MTQSGEMRRGWIEAWRRRVTARGASSRREVWLGAILLIGALSYLRGLANGFVSDDDVLIVTNYRLAQWSFLWKSLAHASTGSSYRYRPLLSIWFGLNYHLFGLWAPGWHALALAAHLAVVWLLYKVAARLAGDAWTGLAAALLFAVMPVNAESVAWVGGAGSLMAGGFELGALYLVMEKDEGERTRLGRWLGACALFAAALLSHEIAMSFPALVGAYALLLAHGEERKTDAPAWMRSRRLLRALVWMAPFALELSAYLVLRRLVLGFWTTDPLAAPNQAALKEVLLTEPWVIAAYLSMLVLPWWAGPAHRVMFIERAGALEFWGPLAALPALGVGFWLLTRKSPRRRLYLFCVLWMAMAITPVLDLAGLRKSGLVHDSYLYLASAGWCVLVGDLLARWQRRGATSRQMALGALAAAAAACAIALLHVQSYWHDDIAFFTHCVEVFPDAEALHGGLGIALGARGDLAGEKRELETAVGLDPSDGVARYQLGVVNVQLGSLSEGAKDIAESIRLMPHPAPESYVSLAQLQAMQGDQSRSEATLKYAEALPGGAKPVGLARADVMLWRRDGAQAETILRPLTARYADDPVVWRELGIALALQGRAEEALGDYRHALELDPGDSTARLLLAKTLHAMGRGDEALEQCSLLLAASPNDAQAQALMAEIKRSASPH